MKQQSRQPIQQQQATERAKQKARKPVQEQQARRPAKNQQGPRPIESHRSGAVPAQDGISKLEGGSSPSVELDDVVGNRGESELDFSEESLSISQTIQLPTLQELSDLPGGSKGGYRKAILRRTIFAVVEALGGEVSIEKSKETLFGQDKPFFRIVITVTIPNDNTLIATGDSYLPEGAMRAAVLHTLAKLRARGLLTLSGLPVNEAFPYETDGLLEVYDYAARYRCIPSVVIQESEAFFSITIHMPEHDIDVAIRNAASIRSAEAAAAREFKRQAELHHLTKGNDKVVVRDRYALSTRNSDDFFTFCLDSGEISGKLRVVTKEDGGLCIGEPQLKDLGFVPEVESEVKTSNRRHTELAATLVAALTVIKMKPHLFEEFSKALRAGNGKYLEKLDPKYMFLEPEVIKELDVIQTLEWPRQSDSNSSRVARPQDDASSETRFKQPLTLEQLATKSSQLQKKMDDYRARNDLASLRHARSELPMTQYASRVRQIVHDNVYCIIVGATGSGKTTQVPQILLDEAIENGNGASCNVICTQPRRIAATSVAQRVAVERAEQLQDTVGYHVRADARPPLSGGSILYCTTGILLQRLLNAPEDVFDRVSHLVIDEVHDRDIIIDFLLITLKKAMAARAAQGKKLPRVVFMSATMDAEQFAAYFRNSLPCEEPNDCPTLSVPGRTFPVREYYLDEALQQMKSKHGEKKLGLLRTDKDTIHFLRAENIGLGDTPLNAGTSTKSGIDWKDESTVLGGGNSVHADNVDNALVPLGLAATTVAHIAKTSRSGAILVFLPGLDEIIEMGRLLRVVSPLGVRFGDAQQFQIIMLHSSIPDSQKTVFDQVPEGCRKVILSTNIAETSVTIPDVRFVVDTGKIREKHYDQTRRITQLQTKWISKSNAKQRAGRAGRVQDGVYYALYTESRRESMRAVALPELLRSDLQETCLDIKAQALKMPVAEFLAGAMEPPPSSSVDIAMRNLMSLGAMTEEEDLTPLGSVLASLPIHPTLGKMIVLGIIFSCLDPMIILGAAAHDRLLFQGPLEKRVDVDRVRRTFADQSESDHWALLSAFWKARELSARSLQEASDFFRQNFISRVAFKSIELTARDIVRILAEAGLVDNEAFEPSLQYGGQRLNKNSHSLPLVKALLVSGLYPNLAVSAGDRVFRTASEKGTKIHPGSVNSHVKSGTRLFTFNDLSLSTKGKIMFMRDTSSVTPLMALLFGGPLAQHHSVLEVGGWLPMSIRAYDTPRASPGDALLADKVMFLRRLLDLMLASAFGDLASSHAPLSGEDHMRRELASRLARVLDLDTGTLGNDVTTGAREKRRRRREKKKGTPSATPRWERRGITRPSKSRQAKDRVREEPAPGQARVPDRDNSTPGNSANPGAQKKKTQKKTTQKKREKEIPSENPNLARRKAKRSRIQRRAGSGRLAPPGRASRSTASQGEPTVTKPARTEAWSRLDMWDRLGYHEAE